MPPHATEGGGARRRIVASVALVLLVGVGLTLVALRRPADGSKAGVPSLDDGARFVFVPSRSAPHVAAIDSKSDRVVATIDVAGVPNQAVVSNTLGVLAVSFAGRSTLEAVGLSGPGQHVTVDLTLTPDVMVLSPDGHLVAAADSRHGAVAVASLQPPRLLFRLTGFGDPRNLTFSLGGSQLYVADDKGLEIAVVDTVRESVVARVPLTPASLPERARERMAAGGAGVSALTRTPDGRFGFVSLAALDSLLVIDLGTLEPVKWLRLGRAPRRPYGTADGRLMLVPNEGDQSVSVIDTTTLDVVATLPGAKDVTAINTGWFESLAFVMSHGDKRVVVLDLMKFRKLGDIDLPGSPGAGVVTGTGQKLYVSLGDVDRAAVIDTQTHTLTGLIDGVGRQPGAAIMARSNNYCH